MAKILGIDLGTTNSCMAVMDNGEYKMVAIGPTTSMRMNPYQSDVLDMGPKIIIVLHAICDALLGAAALGDIGRHFPDTDPQYKGIDSKLLLKAACDLLKKEGYRFCNLDATVVAQAPRLSGHIEDMRRCVADILGCDIAQVNVKATTEEKLGFTGRLEGISAHCVCLIEN